MIQIGKRITMEQGNSSFSLRSVRPLMRGTNTIPPPAPNSPFKEPAAKPETPAPIERFIKIPPVEIFPQEAFFIHF
jgi:hypothetical protein